MSTLEEFENAPAGATATLGWTRAVKTFYDETDRDWLTRGGEWVSAEEMAERRWTLDQSPAVPATAREALDLAWELAHPIKAGQTIPAGTRCIQWHKGTTHWHIYDEIGDFETDVYAFETIRTLDPLPEPEPDWLDAPAVLANCGYHEGIVFSRLIDSDGEVRWWCRECDQLAYAKNLENVTPLYPKEQDA